MSAYDTFRGHFPEFADEAAYSDEMISFWQGIATKQLIQTRWADLYTEGLELATAHYITLAVKNAASPGNAAAGVISSKSVGDVSASYDTQSGAEENGGHWNSTSYGRMFLRLARLCGMGGVQL